MDDKDIRQMGYPCPLGAETGPQTIVVRQVISEAEAQLVLDIHVVVPDPKPSIEQIVDVFVKDVEINCIDVITDKISKYSTSGIVHLLVFGLQSTVHCPQQSNQSK